MVEVTNTISEEKILHYLDVTSKALAKIKLKEDLNDKDLKAANDFLDMANCYFSDANHFKKKGDYINAFAAVNYAHAWLDAGARLKVFDYGNDSVLFAADGSE